MVNVCVSSTDLWRCPEFKCYFGSGMKKDMRDLLASIGHLVVIKLF